MERSACIPLGYGWSSPFVRWQGPFAEVSSIDLAAQVTRQALDRRGVAAGDLTRLILGMTVPQEGSFYAPTTFAGHLGAGHLGGPLIAQACATSVACVHSAATEVAAGADHLTLVVTTDRTSNAPQVVYPAPSAPGGAPVTEHWVLDSFGRDPWGGTSMVATGEAVAAEGGFTRDEIDAATLLRYQQYQAALADDRAFQRAYLEPVELPRRRGDALVVDADVGVHRTTAEGLAKLSPVVPDGVITYGSQTHPADGTAGLIVATEERARALSSAGVARILGFGFARVEQARMPKAPVPAAQRALAAAGVDLDDVAEITTHNPFAVNDLWFARETGVPLERMNRFGSSLVYGHPQGPTGMRLVVELIEALRRRGGGVGLFTGCAAGDTGAAVVLRVED
jgi:acetyl-CoA acetyltransferase family protein